MLRARMRLPQPAAPVCLVAGRCGLVHSTRRRAEFRWQERAALARASSSNDQGADNGHSPQQGGKWDPLQAPLKYASTLHRVNEQYLRLRGRKRWWSGTKKTAQQFPKVMRL
jgi:hypothetical protein